MAVPSLSDYILIARKIIKKYAGSKAYLDEDLEGNVVRAIAYADQTFDESKSVSREHWRHVRAIGYIRKYFQQRKRIKGESPARALTGVSEYYQWDQHRVLIRSEPERPHSRIVKAEEHRDRVEFLAEVLTEARLTKRQLTYVRKYYVDEKTLQEIADEFETSVQNCQQCLSMSLDKIRKIL